MRANKKGRGFGARPCGINALLFAAALCTLFLPWFSLRVGGNTYVYAAAGLVSPKPLALLLFAAPAVGLMISFAPTKRGRKDVALAMVHALGLVMLSFAKPLIFEYGSRFYRFAIGGFACAAVFGVGVMFNVATHIRRRRS
jgi:hypothetical protein